MIPDPPPGWEQRAQRAMRRGRLVDRLLPGLDSPLTHLGAKVGTTIGFAWGFLWSTGQVQRSGDVWVFVGMPRWTFRRGGSCVGSCYLTHDNTGDRVLRHEHVHAAQWRRYGLLMPVMYALAGRDPLRNRFEIEAGLVDGNYLPRRFARREAELQRAVGKP